MNESKTPDFSPQDASSSVSRLGEDEGEPGFPGKGDANGKAVPPTLPDDKLRLAKELALTKAKERCPDALECVERGVDEIVKVLDLKLTPPPPPTDQA